jgi:tetratricopeptide (TPR) repeat protein
MVRYFLVVFLILSGTSIATAVPPDEIADTLSRAESLYYEAKFKDAIQLLQRADDLLRPRSDRMQEKIKVKLQLALSLVGLNNTMDAKTALREIFALDPDYRLDDQQFPPKVVMLADEARTEQSQLRCQAVRDEARNLFQKWDAMGLVNLIQSMKGKCSGLDALEPDAAELLYKAGVDAYKAGQFADALGKFRMAVKLSPKHELAAQYLELTQSKVQVDGDRLVLEWRKTLQSGQFRQAADRYIALKKTDGITSQMLDQMRSDYRRALTPIVESWNRACSSSDTATMESLRGQVPESLPDPQLGDDILAQMKTCTKKGCLQMAAQLALARLKVQVNPVIPPAFQDAVRRSPMTVHVKTRIDEKGEVTAIEAQGGTPLINEAVRSAVDRWKFAPIVDQNGARCVETDIPISLKP